MRHARLLSVVVAGLLAGMLLSGTAAGQDPQPVGTPGPGDRLAPFLQAIRQAKYPQEAMTAYARGAGVDRASVELHDAYMRRMLRFGLPQIALYPARALLALEADNALAWGVIGYNHGKSGELAQALDASLRAADKLRDDPSVLFNAGQLVAWYEGQADPPVLSDAARRLMAALKDELGAKKPFRDGFQAISEAIQREARRQQDLARKTADLRESVGKQQGQVLDLDSRLRDIESQMDARRRLADGLRYDLRHVYGYPYGIRILGHSGMRFVYPWGTIVGNYYAAGYGYLYQPYSSLYVASGYLDRMSQADREVEDLRRQAAPLRREGLEALAELRRMREQLEDLRRQQGRAPVRLERAFRWDPPAVDGVVTDRVEQLPPVAVRPGDVPRDLESEAAQRLALARLYIRHEMNDRALQTLRDLLADYPSTQAAAEARKALAQLAGAP